MDTDTRRIKQNVPSSKFLLSDNVALDGAELIPVSLGGRLMPQSHNLTINELGKELLKASTEGNVDEIRLLMGKGAPFTADWLGTSPLHLAAQNNNLEICEILLRAGISRDARTKVDRTPLHMAAYEGHVDIVECLLKNGADFDCTDLLNMTPLHWAAQNGHDAIASMLIRYGAATDGVNKFGLTPTDIANQINRPDITEIITISMRDPLIATQHLALEMICENTESPVAPTVEDDEGSGQSETECSPIPIETVMLDENDDSISFVEEENSKEQQEEETVETIEAEDNTFSESFKLLQQHGITMLPVDDSHILNSVMETGHSVVLTEAGKQALNSIKSTEEQEAQDLSEYLKPKAVVTPIKKKKIITVTPEQFLAMTANGTFNSNTNVLKQINGKIINNIQKTIQLKRVVMKKNKIVPMGTPHVTKVQKYETIQNVERLVDELQKAQSLIETYKRKLIKSEIDAARYKQQIKVLMAQKKLGSS